MSLVKIATFNVNSVKSRQPILEKWLASDNAPDVLCMQETKCQDADFPVDFFKNLGYFSAFRGMKSYNGVAIVSKIEPESVAFGLGDDESAERETEENARVVRARFDNFDLINTYVPQGKEIVHADYKYKLRFFERLYNLFAREFKSSENFIWVGDLNVAPTEIDVTNPKNKREHVCFHEDVKAAFASTMEWGLVDVFRQHRPEAGEFSFWDYRVKDALARNIGWRLDHILGTKSAAEASRDAWVERDLRATERPSDHTAVVASFVF